MIIETLAAIKTLMLDIPHAVETFAAVRTSIEVSNLIIDHRILIVMLRFRLVSYLLFSLHLLLHFNEL
jgi:hypothetical protein